MDILKKTLEEMNDIFTSFIFGEAAIKNGYPKELLRNGGNYRFLMKHCTNAGYRSKTWHKNSSKKDNISSQTVTENNSNDIKNAINILKNAGYKIMKPVDNWEEI